MKKILTILAALAFAGVVNAGHRDNGGIEQAGSMSGTLSGSSAVAGGVSTGNQGASGAYQSSISGAANNTGAGFSDRSHRGNDRTIGAEAHSGGYSYSSSYGTKYGRNASGNTSGIAMQGGIASSRAGANVSARDGTGGGFAFTTSKVRAGTLSATTVTNRGTAYDGSDSYASSQNDARLAINNGTADHQTSSAAEAQVDNEGGKTGNGQRIGMYGAKSSGFGLTFAITQGGRYDVDFNAEYAQDNGVEGDTTP